MSTLLTTLEERLISEAEFGLFHFYGNITHKKAIELRKEGFIVKDSMENKRFPRNHRIYWGQAVVDCDDVHTLNENNPEYSFAQKLWVIAMKNQPAFRR